MKTLLETNPALYQQKDLDFVNSIVPIPAPESVMSGFFGDVDKFIGNASDFVKKRNEEIKAIQKLFDAKEGKTAGQTDKLPLVADSASPQKTMQLEPKKLIEKSKNFFKENKIVSALVAVAFGFLLLKLMD